MPKFRRGLPVATRKVADKKLKGRLKHTEALAEEAATSAAKAHQWLLPDAAGSLEAEGMERTWRFAQSDMLQGERRHWAPGCLGLIWSCFRLDGRTIAAARLLQVS